MLRGIASADEHVRHRAWDALAEAYWRPVYTYLRLRWRADADEAQDLTQGFFARALEKDFFARYEPARARFRTFLRTCLDGYVSNQRAASRRLKRGGGLLSVDFAAAESALAQPPAGDQDVEELFRREWVRSLFAAAVQDLQARCAAGGKQVPFAVFERYDLDAPPEGRPTYAALAEEFALPVTQVTNYLSAMRREFRRLVLERLRALTASEEEFRAEARDLLGGAP